MCSGLVTNRRRPYSRTWLVIRRLRWGRDTDLTRTLTDRVAKYAAAVNLYQGEYRERLTNEDQAQVGYLLLPPLPKQFRQRFVPVAERRLEAERNRKIKTDVVSERAMAILALMLARYPSMERFIRWYPQQIERIEAGELSIPARLVYEDDQLDLPSQPGPDASASKSCAGAPQRSTSS